MHIKNYLLLGATLLTTSIGTNQAVQSAPRLEKTVAKSKFAISSPKNNAIVDSPLTVRGTAPQNQQMKINVTAVYDGGQRNLGALKTTANAKGHWSTKPIQLLLPKNAKNAHFKIVASYTTGKQTFSLSPIQVRLKPSSLSVQPKTEIKPYPRPKLVPVKPRNYVKPDITYPTAGLHLTMPYSYPVRGKATPNRDVSVTVVAKWTKDNRSTTRIIDQKTIRTPSNGKWSVDMHYESVGVEHPSSYEVIAEDTAFQDKDMVIVHERIKPSILFPHENEEWVANGNYSISGKGAPGHQLKLTITAHWTTINGNTRQNHQRSIAAANAIQINDFGKWSIRQKFEPIDSGNPASIPFYIVEVIDTTTRASAAVSVRERD